MKAATITTFLPAPEMPAQTSAWTRLTMKMRQQPLWLAVTPSVFITLIMGWIDRVTGWELSLFIFYAFPIVLAVWWGGSRAGIGSALLCGGVWWVANTDTHPYETLAGFVWALINREFYFFVMVFAVVVVRKKQDDDAARIRMLEERRQLEQDIVRVSEHEQQRIGQDLHDGLCQQLAAIGCATRVLADELQSRQVPEACDAVMIEESIQQAVMEARNLARGIFPVHVDRDGLSAALSDLVRITSKFTGVSIKVEENTEIHLASPEAAMHLYRIVQEAVANAVRHGAADQILIRLDFHKDTLELSIEDNGSGFTQEKKSTDGGMGLRTMYYRAQSLSAQLAVKPRPGGGTIVQCLLPAQFLPHTFP